ncbi:cell wall-associated hydrolase, invasion-associated protein [Frankia torreyi]|uniref:Cell wall-associated hydrolase, invasion-associated protein n=1 Tax=Frankia torreyi TaxID=1856 RepID=A0A0D8B876_9ACTN|nr:cell wall-associated hydrolase, invasion-associated protein [Frankia torreyi]KQM02715.1 cell wall-associated hydrolase, invasion-associated protein [Frankia sp. CpI1-P]
MSSVPTEGWHSVGEPDPETRHPSAAGRRVPIDPIGVTDLGGYAEPVLPIPRQRPGPPSTRRGSPKVAAGKVARDNVAGSKVAGLFVLGLAGILFAGSATIGGPAGSAWAVPASSAARPTSQSLADIQAEIGRTRSKLDESAQQAASAAEAFNAGRIRLAEAERAAKDAATRVDRADRAVRGAADQHRGLAVSADRAGGFAQVSLLLTGDPRRALDRAGAVDALARRQRVADTGLRLARRDLTEARRGADAALADKKKIIADLAERKRTIEAAADEQHGLLQRLESRYAELERQAKARQAAAARAWQAAAAAAAAQAARQAAAERVRYGQESGVAAAAGRAFAAAPLTAAAAAPVRGGGGAATAVREAYAQLGKPYVWGAEGPATFDCSGLTQWVWGKAGVALSHYTGSQWDEGRRVSRAALKAGDLVFFHPDLGHVGIYVGNGKMIHAPRTGEVVRVENVWWTSFQGGIRPGA